MSERVDRYRKATEAMDFETLGELRHPDFQCCYPQSGERIVGHDNWVAAHQDYESHFGDPVREHVTVKGGEQHAKATATFSPTLPFFTTPLVSVSDTGDLVVVEGGGCWPDGKVYNWVMILEYRDGLVWRETDYFAEPFEAPEWRKPFTVPMEFIS